MDSNCNSRFSREFAFRKGGNLNGSTRWEAVQKCISLTTICNLIFVFFAQTAKRARHTKHTQQAVKKKRVFQPRVSHLRISSLLLFARVVNFPTTLLLCVVHTTNTHTCKHASTHTGTQNTLGYTRRENSTQSPPLHRYNAHKFNSLVSSKALTHSRVVRVVMVYVCVLFSNSLYTYVLYMWLTYIGSESD